MPLPYSHIFSSAPCSQMPIHAAKLIVLYTFFLYTFRKMMAINLETTRLRGKPRNRCQDEVREDGRKVAGEGCQENI
jgi:hypothetical protein